MRKTLVRTSKRLVNTSWKGSKWLFLLTLPLTAIYIINGSLGGIYYTYWTNSLFDTHLSAFLYEIKELVDDWSVTQFNFRRFQDIHNDFHVLRLNSNDWASKLGFVLPREYGDWDRNEDAPLDKYASLDTLMLDVRAGCNPTAPKEQWVYISDYGWESDSNWDGAFSAAVQAGYVPSALNQTRLFFATCYSTAGFLCGVWGVRAPTLLHFLVEDSPPLIADIAPGLTYYATSLSDLRPVTVRVIEFPLEGAYTGRSLDVFPGRKEQMLSIMRGGGLYEQFEPWNDSDQKMKRFKEYMTTKFQSRGNILSFLQTAEEWVDHHVVSALGLETGMAIVDASFFIVAWVATDSLLMMPYQWVKHLVLSFLGYPKRTTWIFGDGSQRERNVWVERMDDVGSRAWGMLLLALKQLEIDRNWPEGRITTDGVPRATPSFEGFARTDPTT